MKSVSTTDASPAGVIKCLEDLSRLHMALCVEPLLRLYPAYADDPWDSIRVFVHGYAFEHQGRSPDFGPAAVAAVGAHSSPSPDRQAAAELWTKFTKNLGGTRPNAGRSAMCPKGTDYTQKNGPYKTQQPSVTEFCEDGTQRRPLVAWACDKIRSGEVHDAHERLCAINGIGPKIASLFLRDMAIHAGLTPSREEQDLLQPIDVWVRLVAKLMSPMDLMSAKSCAGFLVGCSSVPERLNQGIWYFCARVCESSSFTVKRALKDEAQMWSLICRHVSLMREAAVVGQTLQGSESHVGGRERTEGR